MKKYRAIRRLSIDGQEGFVEPGEECELPDFVADLLLARGSVILSKDYVEPVIPPSQKYIARVPLVSRLDNGYIESGQPVTLTPEAAEILIAAGSVEPDPIPEPDPPKRTRKKAGD